ncbi:MAG: sulfatase [Planctomycetota bacterium]
MKSPHKRIVLGGFVLGGLGLALAACGGVQADGPSVLLVTVDCLRADHVGAYGYERDTTPNLDAFAAEAALFERAYSHAPFTAPSHASLFTGVLPHSHGLVFWGHRIDPSVPSLASLFGDAGYATGAFQNHPGLPPTGLLDDFDTVVTETTGPWPDTVENFFEWVDGRDRPFAAWVHLWDVHRPYGFREWTRDSLDLYQDERREPGRLPYAEVGFGPKVQDPRVGRIEAHYNLNRDERAGALPVAYGGPNRRFTPADWEYIANRYDNAVRYADAGLKALFDGLEERGIADDTVVVITADHGETLTEREEVWFTHDPFLFEETLHVPLLIRFPGGRHAGLRTDALARGIDVLPTLLGAARVAAPGELQGRDLDDVLAGRDTAPALLLAETRTKTAKASSARTEEGWLEHRQAVTDGRHKLIWDLNTNQGAFFDLVADPGERTNLLAGEGDAPDEAIALYRELERLRQLLPLAPVVSNAMSCEQYWQMVDLGYIDEIPGKCVNADGSRKVGGA